MLAMRRREREPRAPPPPSRCARKCSKLCKKCVTYQGEKEILGSLVSSGRKPLKKKKKHVSARCAGPLWEGVRLVEGLRLWDHSWSKSKLVMSSSCSSRLSGVTNFAEEAVECQAAIGRATVYVTLVGRWDAPAGPGRPCQARSAGSGSPRDCTGGGDTKRSETAPYCTAP